MNRIVPNTWTIQRLQIRKLKNIEEWACEGILTENMESSNVFSSLLKLPNPNALVYFGTAIDKLIKFFITLRSVFSFSMNKTSSFLLT